jgi:hypothetical protein
MDGKVEFDQTDQGDDIKALARDADAEIAGMAADILKRTIIGPSPAQAAGTGISSPGGTQASC